MRLLHRPTDRLVPLRRQRTLELQRSRHCVHTSLMRATSNPLQLSDDSGAGVAAWETLNVQVKVMQPTEAMRQGRRIVVICGGSVQNAE